MPNVRWRVGLPGTARHVLEPALLLVAVLSAVAPQVTLARPQEEPRPLLVILTETGDSRDGLPVYAHHPEGPAIADVLSRGVSGVLLRAYRKEQEYLRRSSGVEPEPAYLLMSSRQGGFARYGFWLGDVRKESVAYVDLHRDKPLTGRFAAMDQLLPHELFHAILHQLTGDPESGFANQVHALGVRTDRGVAFNEGFAEHFQTMAVEHPEAAPETRALASDPEPIRRARRNLAAYRRELVALVAVTTRMRVGFPFWYSNAEGVLRYHAVKNNSYARAPRIPERLLGPDPYDAYLLESIVPATPTDPPRSVSRLIQTEAFVAAVMYRWANHPGLQATYREPTFYEAFGVLLEPGRPDARATLRRRVGPLENVYLKIFEVLHRDRPDGILEMVHAYRERFPDEAEAVDAVLGEVLLGQSPEPPPEIWLANPHFRTGTTLFDQFRGLPRMHTFDLNSASVVELVAVPGVDRSLAEAIRAGAPFRSLDELAEVPGTDAAIIDRFEGMRRALEEWRAEPDLEAESLSLGTLLAPYGRRLGWTLLAAGALGAILFRLVRQVGAGACPSWWRAGINGLAAALIAMPCGWLVGLALADSVLAPVAPAVGALAAVAAVLGLPASAWFAWRHSPRRNAVTVLLSWVAAAVPAAVAITPIL